MTKFYAQNDKVILTDCDGVLLDWEYAFDSWMFRHGYTLNFINSYNITERYNISKQEASKSVNMFNESAWIRRLSPLRDSIKYVKKLHEEHGYVFHCISSLSDDEYSQHLRTKNLQELFGNTAFQKFTYLKCGADKLNTLKEYKNSECWWIEDVPKNADHGSSLNLNSIVMAHEWNKNYSGTRVQNWKEIYHMITGE